MGPAKPKAPAGSIGALFDEYEADFERAVVRDEWREYAKDQAVKLIKYMALYEQVANKVGSMSPLVVGLAHMMECDFSFKGHLHNGDPLTKKTYNYPPGRPFEGEPPFNWVDSAVDALLWDADKWPRIRKGYKAQSLPEMLDYLERYNGLGSRRKGIHSPYLWSGSSLYEKGKFVKDFVWDPNAVSKQVGCATVLKVYYEMKN